MRAVYLGDREMRGCDFSREISHKIFTRQIKTAPLQRQRASFWATKYNDETISHLWPTFSPASKNILILLYTASQFEKVRHNIFLSSFWINHLLIPLCPGFPGKSQLFLPCPCLTQSLWIIASGAETSSPPMQSKQGFLTSKLQLKLFGFPSSFYLELVKDKYGWADSSEHLLHGEKLNQLQGSGNIFS